MSKWRSVQRGGDRGCLIYLCGPGADADRDGIGDLDEAIAAALPGVSIAATSESGYGALLADVDAGLKACGATTCDALAGFSAGCQGVRQHLQRGLAPSVSILVDGTSGPWPLPTRCPELAIWESLAAEAARGERTLVMTATLQRYTQRLSKARDGHHPFAATSTVLARALGWPEAEALPALNRPMDVYPGNPVLELHRGRLHALLYPGTDCDAKAHSAQLVHVLPALLRQYAAPALGLGIPEHRWDLGGRLAQLADELTDWAGATWDALSTDGAGGSVLPSAVEHAHGYRCSVAELIADARAIGTYHPRGSGYRPKVGDLLCSARGGGDPERGGSGHVERVSVAKRDAVGLDVLISIGGNEAGDTWVEAAFDLSQPSYRGCIEVPEEIGRRAVEIAREELRAGVREIPGARHHERIQEYHAGARLGGTPRAGMPGHETEGVAVLGKKAPDEVPWCASSASWCAYRASM